MIIRYGFNNSVDNMGNNGKKSPGGATKKERE
jgi:hypothetical protein